MSRAWAWGRPLPPEAFDVRESDSARAVIMSKAYTETGGTVVETAELEDGRYCSSDAGTFHVQRPTAGSQLPGPFETGKGAAIEEFPLFCVNALTIQAAQEQWYRSLEATGLLVERDGKRYGPESERQLTDYYVSSGVA